MADKTFNCDDSLKEKVIRGKIEKKNILHLGDGSNSDIYVFAMSLGVSRNKKVSSEKSNSYLRFSAIENSKEMSYIYSVALNELRAEGKENQINDDDVVRKIVEEYVNGGLTILDEMIGDIDNFDEERFLYDIINEIDTVYYDICDGYALSE
ncbi:hypothetical protein [Anaerovibrio sp. JC8]|uniref:hypothetical protein n=1 Tax=Anaerovibrio sp. JC8 TaxID=1240085 RepID=UPI000A10CF4A|nr:hypothetical protein [Anaerovibrio sp. JC8]